MDKIIILSGKIDSSNVDKEEEKINKELDEYIGDVTIDADKLEYISSAGLRVILKIKKKWPNTKIINCNNDVYEIFEMTGFNQMMNITRKYKTISVDGCSIVAEGAYGIIYRLDSETIVKVYKNSNSLDDIIRENEKAKKAFILGIPTAISYNIVKVGDSYGSVFEMIDAKTFAELLRDGEDIKKLAKESVNILKQIHNTENLDNSLPNKKKEAINWAKFCKDYLPNEVGDKLVSLFEEIPDCNTIIHGDFHIKNIMHLKNEILLIDMETLAIGHPILELACSYTVYEGFECVDINNPEEFLGIPRSQCREFIDLTLKYYFDDYNDKKIEEILNKIKIICYTRLLRRQIKHYGINDKNAIHSIEFCKKHLIDNVLKCDNLYF